MSFTDRSYQMEAADTCPEALTISLAGKREDQLSKKKGAFSEIIAA